VARPGSLAPQRLPRPGQSRRQCYWPGSRNGRRGRRACRHGATGRDDGPGRHQITRS